VDRQEEIQYLSIEAEHSRVEEEKLQALARASEEITRKKELYERSFGLRLVPRGLVSESVSRRDALPRQRRYELQAMSLQESGRSYAAATVPAQIPSQPDMAASFGELIYVATVAVEFLVDSREAPETER
jgi:hypothetical protein